MHKFFYPHPKYQLLNTLVLKLLQKSYANKIKMIYDLLMIEDEAKDALSAFETINHDNELELLKKEGNIDLEQVKAWRNRLNRWRNEYPLLVPKNANNLSTFEPQYHGG